MHSRALVVSAVVLLVGCNGITYPTHPAITPPPSDAQPTNLVLTAKPDRLPHTGGSRESSCGQSGASRAQRPA
jgi:hypothetical protein